MRKGDWGIHGRGALGVMRRRFSRLDVDTLERDALLWQDRSTGSLYQVDFRSLPASALLTQTNRPDYITGLLLNNRTWEVYVNLGEVTVARVVGEGSVRAQLPPSTLKLSVNETTSELRQDV